MTLFDARHEYRDLCNRSSGELVVEIQSNFFLEHGGIVDYVDFVVVTPFII